nr:unnamed protein product [Callosobruchus chinensis]
MVILCFSQCNVLSSTYDAMDLYLTHINLSKNKIHKIESGAFENCANITKLDLSFNQIATLPKKAFDETTYATELQLSYNLFENMTQ